MNFWRHLLEKSFGRRSTLFSEDHHENKLVWGHLLNPFFHKDFILFPFSIPHISKESVLQ